jgi:hypothetical protein
MVVSSADDSTSAAQRPGAIHRIVSIGSVFGARPTASHGIVGSETAGCGFMHSIKRATLAGGG